MSTVYAEHYEVYTSHQTILQTNTPSFFFCFDRGRPVVLIMTIILNIKQSSNTTFNFGR